MLMEGYNPSSCNAALMSSNFLQWKSAMDEEMASLAENKTWELVYLLNGRKVIDDGRILQVKTDQGNQDKYKRQKTNT